jgi:hypothetical protein
MIVADVLAITFTFIGFFITLTAVWLLFGAFWPNVVGRAQERCHKNPYKTFLVGVGVTAVFTLLVTGLAAVAPPLSMLLFAFASGYSLLGLSGLARFVGTRLPSSIDASSPWRTHLRGSIVLELTFLFPILGWIMIFPMALIVGCGAATLALFSRGQVSAATPVPARERIEVMA